MVVLGGSGANGLDSWSKNGHLQWSLLIVPTDHELLGSMMSRLAQAEQQLKAAQTQLLEKVKKTIVNIYYSTVNNYDVVKYNLSYVKCKTVLVSGLPCCRHAEWLGGLQVVTWFYSSAVEVNFCSRVLGPFRLWLATSLPAPPPSL